MLSREGRAMAMERFCDSRSWGYPVKFRDIFDAIKPLAGVAATINPVVGAKTSADQATSPNEATA